MIAIVNFRTMANGSFKYVRRWQRRGYWRVLIVRDATGSTKVDSKNVIGVIYTGRPGIDGVTERSSYYLGYSRAHAEDLANRENLTRFAVNLSAAYHPLSNFLK